MSTIRQVWQLIQQGNYAFSMDHKYAYLHIPIVKYYHCFLWFVWQHKPYHLKVLLFGLAMAPKVSSHILNPYCFFVITRVSVLLFIWMIAWSLLILSALAREVKLCGLHWFVLDYIFPSLNSVSHRNFLFWDCVVIHWICQSLYHLTNILRSSNLLLLCYGGNPLHSNRLCLFKARPPFVPMVIHPFTCCEVSFWVTCWMLTIFLLISFFLFIFLFQQCQLQRLSQLQQSLVPL